MMQWLKLQWWPPLSVNSTTNMNNKAHRKKLLLTALAVAVMRADAASPATHFSKDRDFITDSKILIVDSH